MLLLDIEVQVHVDADGCLRPQGQHRRRYYFVDLIVEDDYLQLGLGRSPGMAEDSICIAWTDLRPLPEHGVSFDLIDLKEIPVMTGWFSTQTVRFLFVIEKRERTLTQGVLAFLRTDSLVTHVGRL